MTDRELLDQYVRNGSEEAFRQLVATHVDLVYSCARQRMHDSHLAEDVTQTVFAVLARKASTIPSNAALAGWLFTATRYAVAVALRAERRRRHYEREAAQMTEVCENPNAHWQQLSPHLQEGLTRLPRHERDTILLRYFQGKSMREAAATLGISEDAAAKRASRAMQRLRTFFTRKGIALSVAGITTAISAHAVEAAPAGLAATATSTALAATTGIALPAHLALAANRVVWAMFIAKLRVAAVIVASTVAIGVTAAVVWQSLSASNSRPALPSHLAAADVRRSWGPQWNSIPIAPGWPVALPGSVTGTPALADLDGDGRPEIVVTSMGRGPSRGAQTPSVIAASVAGYPTQTRHPNPTIAATVFAFHADGTPVKGWPIVLFDESGRAADRAARPAYADDWAASPSVADLDGNGREEIVITAQPRRTFIINGDGSRRLSPQGLPGGEVWSSFPIVDLNTDGKLELIGPNIAIASDGKSIPGWAPQRPVARCFAPCIGDSNADGQFEIYYGAYRREDGMVHGLDHTGKEIPGWPQFVADQSLFPPVMGDVDGDGKMEIFVTDNGGHLMAWTWNGRPLLPGIAPDGMTGIFKDGVVANAASPTLADLDGDRRAEVIVFDQKTRSIKAWRGDGRGLFANDGTIISLPDAQCSGAVTVGDLGGDGVMDLFVGTYWVQLAKDGKATATNMLPSAQSTNGGCLISDLDRDGKAEIVFGTADGQVFVYRTGMGYGETRMQWPTPNGDQRHTGVWRRPPSK